MFYSVVFLFYSVLSILGSSSLSSPRNACVLDFISLIGLIFTQMLWVPESDPGIIFYVPNPADEVFLVAMSAKEPNSWGNQLQFSDKVSF